MIFPLKPPNFIGDFPARHVWRRCDCKIADLRSIKPLHPWRCLFWHWPVEKIPSQRRGWGGARSRREFSWLATCRACCRTKYCNITLIVFFVNCPNLELLESSQVGPNLTPSSTCHNLTFPCHRGIVQGHSESKMSKTCFFPSKQIK